jgi:hypothetical protein
MVLGVLIAAAPKVTTAVRLKYFDRQAAEIERLFMQHLLTVKEMEKGVNVLGW